MAVVPTLDSTLGAVFIGFGFACVVYGTLLTQVFYYFWRYPVDRWMFKCLVLLIVLLETADQMCIGHLIYYYSIVNYLKPLVLLAATTTWSLILQLTFGAIVGCIVKTYFAFRVWRFSGRNIFITGLVLLLALGQLGLALTYTIKAFALPNIYSVQDLQVLGTVSLGVGVLTDIVTAASLCYYLNRLRTGYTTSDSLVNSLSKYAVNTGAVTSTVSVAVLILYNAMPDNNLYFAAVYFTLSKMYAISFMATLNTRRQVRGRGTDRQGDTNNTNLFHLGTRMPSVGVVDHIITNGWSKIREPEFQLVTFHQEEQLDEVNQLPHQSQHSQSQNSYVQYFSQHSQGRSLTRSQSYRSPTESNSSKIERF
ncbi:hypothetical protein BDQ17DRAFT_1366867 [Cyathus striatus]|nr:hypothetical protein BDQ17DRAFT_1366867 [Cyathus striatus]